MNTDNSFYKFMVLFRRDFLNVMINPVLFLTNTIFPLLLILTLGYLGESMYGGGGVTSYDYYSITILIFMAVNVSMTASNSFMESSIKTTNLRTIFAPIRLSSIYLSKIISTFVFAAICQMLLMLVLGIGFGFQIGGANVWAIVIILLLLNLFSSTLGVLFCCIFRSEELSNKILSIINNVFAVMGGLFFSLDRMGRTAETISYLSPVKWVAETLLRIIYDEDFSLLLPTAAVLIGATALFIVACRVAFRRNMEDLV